MRRFRRRGHLGAGIAQGLHVQPLEESLPRAQENGSHRVAWCAMRFESGKGEAGRLEFESSAFAFSPFPDSEVLFTPAE
jgi:hypothetical protein